MDGFMRDSSKTNEKDGQRITKQKEKRHNLWWRAGQDFW